MSELKQCPFCGSEAHIVNDNVECSFCFVTSLTDWNTRPIEDALRAELEKTQKALDMACGFTVLNAGETVTHWKEYYLKMAGE